MPGQRAKNVRTITVRLDDATHQRLDAAVADRKASGRPYDNRNAFVAAAVRRALDGERER